MAKSDTSAMSAASGTVVETGRKRRRKLSGTGRAVSKVGLRVIKLKDDW